IWTTQAPWRSASSTFSLRRARDHRLARRRPELPRRGAGPRRGLVPLAPGVGGHPARAPTSGARRLRLSGRWARRRPRWIGGRRPRRRRQGDEQTLRTLEGGGQVPAGDPTSQGRPGGPGTSRLAGARIECGTLYAPGRRAKPRPLDKLEGIGVRGTATESVQRQPYSGERQAERPDAQDQRMGRHNRRAYRDSEHLRDELPLHAGDRLELWVPLALLAMVAICVVLYVVFKRIGWL